jgi:hypothetical protein
MGNALFRLPSSAISLYEAATPQIGKIARKDEAPLEDCLPEYLVEPFEYNIKNNEKLEQVQLIDFGEGRHPRIHCGYIFNHAHILAFLTANPPGWIYTSTSLHPPELVFRCNLTKAIDM